MTKRMFQLGDPRGDQSFRKRCRISLPVRGVNAARSRSSSARNDYLLMLLSWFLGTDYLVAMENPPTKQAYRIF